MLANFWDNPMIGGIAFPARQEPMPAAGAGGAGVTDGVVACGDVSVGYRLYANVPAADRKAVALWFHGNAEICTDLDHSIDRFYRAGVVVLSADFRGYGWSSGSPTFGTIGPDAESVAAAMPAILAKAGVDAGLPKVICGRSIGATAAVHLAANGGGAPFAGLLLEAGLISVKDLPMLAPLANMIPGAEMLLPMLPEPVQTLQKLGVSRLPLLLIHGDRDEIVPYAQATKALAASPAAQKQLVTISGAGHNDLLMCGEKQYFDAVAAFIAGLAPLSADDVGGMSVKELKAALTARGVDYSTCVEKSEMRGKLLAALPAAGVTVETEEVD